MTEEAKQIETEEIETQRVSFLKVSRKPLEVLEFGKIEIEKEKKEGGKEDIDDDDDENIREESHERSGF